MFSESHDGETLCLQEQKTPIVDDRRERISVYIYLFITSVSECHIWLYLLQFNKRFEFKNLWAAHGPGNSNQLEIVFEELFWSKRLFADKIRSEQMNFTEI